MNTLPPFNEFILLNVKQASKEACKKVKQNSATFLGLPLFLLNVAFVFLAVGLPAALFVAFV